MIKATLYITPYTVPNTTGSNIVVGNSVKDVIGGANIDPIINLIAAPYSVRIVGGNYNTEFNIDLTLAPTGSVVNAANYIV